MRPTNYLPEPSLLLSAIASVAFFAAPASAQDDATSATGDDQATSVASDDAATSTDAAPATTASDDPASTTAEAATSTTADGASITNTGDATTTEAMTDAPTITGGSQATSGDELTGFPTLTGGASIPTYPAAAVPPTNNAPFMHHSSAPDGTVFIAVGAILGAFAIGILLWRIITTFLLHRSVERAAMAQHAENNKTGFPVPPAPFYKYTDQGSTMSLTGAAAAGRGVRRTNRGPTPSSNPSQSNLFFSPTAAGAGAGGNRSSAFLPSGFYAAGNSSPGPGSHGHSISLTNLRPDSRGHYGNASRHTLNPSPPDSPGFPARRDMSTSSVNLHAPLGPGQRAPSAYLEDLLADDPSSLPPPHMPPSTGPPRPSSTNLGPNRI